MITPKLEELIWEGRATFKTYIAGGSGKPTLNIEQDKFIVITDITFFNQLTLPKSAIDNLNSITNKGLTTQVTILGNKGFNRFLFRNNFNLVKVDGKDVHLPFGHCKLDTYLIHTDSVSFSFSKGVTFSSLTNGSPATTENPAYPRPLDYGRDGIPNINTIRSMQYLDPLPLTWNFEAQALKLAPGSSGQTITQEFTYPVTPTTDMNSADNIWQFAAPILHVNYVEIKGLPNNINTK